jgi:hypothetical protein
MLVPYHKTTQRNNQKEFYSNLHRRENHKSRIRNSYVNQFSYSEI